MEHFRNAKVVRLLSRHDKYLTADDDSEDGVRQHRSGGSPGAKWTVEVVEGRRGKADVIRLKSCSYNRYLAASDKRFLLGATGRRVVLLDGQPQNLGDSIEWQPIHDGTRCVKLRTKSGTFLRANGLIKPYGNTVTHGNPHRTVTQDWVLWEVDVVDMADHTTAEPPPKPATHVVVTPTSPYPRPADALTPGGKKNQRQASTGFPRKVLAALASVGGAHSRRSSSVVSNLSASSGISQEDVSYTPSPRSVDVESPARPIPTPFGTSSTDKITVTTARQPSSADNNSTVSSAASTPESSPPRRAPMLSASLPRRVPSPDSSPPRRMPTRGSSPPRKAPSPDSSPRRRTPTPPRRVPSPDSSPPRRMPTRGSAVPRRVPSPNSSPPRRLPTRSSAAPRRVPSPDSSPPRRLPTRGSAAPRRVPSPDSSPPRRLPTRGSAAPRRVPSPDSSPPRRMPTRGSAPPRKIPSPVSSPPRRTSYSPSSSPDNFSPVLLRKESIIGGRLIVYYFADDDGGVDDSFPSDSFEFHGSTARELIDSVEEMTGLDEFILCKRNPLNGKLYRIMVDVPLPPDRAPMTVFIVHPMSKVAGHIV